MSFHNADSSGYKVEENKATPAAAPVTAAPATTTATPEPTKVPEPVAAPAQSTVNAATPGPAAPAATQPKKKKGGLFASCCGKGDHIE